jgi:hypothetical protein
MLKKSFLTCLTALSLLPPLAWGDVVTFSFNGSCFQACSEVGLSNGQSVTGSLKIERDLLPTEEGVSVEIPNSNLLDLHFSYGSETFSISDVVLSDRLVFSLLSGRHIISNGDGILARNGGFELLIAPAPTPYSLPTVSAFLYAENVSSTGTFAHAVPEPGTYLMFALGALLVLCRAHRQA